MPVSAMFMIISAVTLVQVTVLNSKAAAQPLDYEIRSKAELHLFTKHSVFYCMNNVFHRRYEINDVLDRGILYDEIFEKQYDITVDDALMKYNFIYSHEEFRRHKLKEGGEWFKYLSARPDIEDICQRSGKAYGLDFRNQGIFAMSEKEGKFYSQQFVSAMKRSQVFSACKDHISEDAVRKYKKDYADFERRYISRTGVRMYRFAEKFLGKDQYYDLLLTILPTTYQDAVSAINALRFGSERRKWCETSGDF